jgi:hypothetical protein
MIFIEIYAKLLTKIKTFSHNLFAGKTREGLNKINQTDLPRLSRSESVLDGMRKLFHRGQINQRNQTDQIN